MMEKDNWEIYEKKEIIDDLYQNKFDKNNKQIDIIFNDNNDEKEKYKLISEEKELLLCKENIINQTYKDKKEYEIKIKDLYKGEEGKDFYYINKENLKEKYLKYVFELNKNYNDIMIDNNNEEEMNKLYKEINMRHPRKIIDGKIVKYSFYSWTGFFCCKKNEFYSLGFGVFSYFKTLKLFILFFSLIAIINLIAAFHYTRYNSVFDIDQFLIKTTLGNTMTTTYNYIFHFYNYSNIENKDNHKSLFLNCSNKKIGKFISGFKYNLNEYEIEKIDKKYKENYMDNIEITIPSELFKQRIKEKYSINIEYYNKQMEINKCFLKNFCNLTLENDNSINSDLRYSNHIHYLIYECIDYSLLPKNHHQNSLKHMTLNITIITAFLLIFLYTFFKFAIIYEKKEYNKNRVNINDYVLVLRKLSFKSKDYYQEINDLINHLNNIIKNELNQLNGEISNILISNKFENNFEKLNIFDITISNINEKKKGIIEKIKSIQNTITNIKENNDSIKKKIKNKINDAYKSVNTLYKNITNKEENLMAEKYIDRINSLSVFSEEENPLEKEENISINRSILKEKLINITDEIIKLHNESQRKYYVDIYLTFKNPSTKKLVYKIYKKNKCKRCIKKCFCYCCNPYKKYYYKNQWLNFENSRNAPNNIIWENCYILTKKKKLRRILSFLVSFIIFISSTLIIFHLNYNSKINDAFTNLITILICQIINIFSSSMLEKLTDYEKYSTLSKRLSSNIQKIFILNFLITGISISLRNIFIYDNVLDNYEIINNVLINMFYSIFTSHASPLCKYLYKIFLRYLDSKFTNGKSTKLNNKKKYEKLYTGEDFPISHRYSIIFVNLYITLLYGTYCPLIYLLFLLFLVFTFIVDKYLIINFYKNPPYYDNYLSKMTSTFLFFGIILFFYGTIHYLSDPYLFNYYQNNSYKYSENEKEFYFVINPFTSFYYLYAKSQEIPILIYNFSGLISPVFHIFISSFLPFALFLEIIKICCKRISKISTYPNIGFIYSINDLNKYYEVKKLELFKLVLNCDNQKLMKNYIYLINNHKLVIDYIKDNIDYKNNKNRQSNEIQNISKNNNENKILLDNPSYNLSFIQDYEIYNYFDLLYYV